MKDNLDPRKPLIRSLLQEAPKVITIYKNLQQAASMDSMLIKLVQKIRVIFIFAIITIIKI